VEQLWWIKKRVVVTLPLAGPRGRKKAVFLSSSWSKKNREGERTKTRNSSEEKYEPKNA